ncbi:MAG: hypothetical protein M3R44_03500 [Candidatus Eremiobacteraeota bacterium]|nr:hypothetical protein [Candidatus Eremiobacteraeota bacterium]
MLRGRALLRSDFLRHSAVVFTASLLINMLGYGFHFAISRRIGVVAYGVLSALNAGYMIALTLAMIANTVVVKYAAELRAQPDSPARLAAFVQRVVAFGAAASCACIVAGLLALRPIAAFLHVSDLRAVAFTIVIIGLTVSGSPMRAVFQGIEEFVTFSWLALCESFVKAGAGIAFVYVGFGVAGAFGGWLCGTVLALAITTFVLLRRFRWARGARLDLDLRRLIGTTANVAAAAVLLGIISYVDVLIVKHYADPTTAGLYGALSLAGKILLFFVSFVPTIVLPKATRLALAGRSPLPVLLQAAAVTVAISAVGLCVYAIAPGLIVTTLAGRSFAAAAPYVFPYGVAMVLLAMLNVVVTYKIGVHRFDFIAPLALVAVAEIVGIALHHRTLSDVITILIAVNAFALVASLFRVNARLHLPVVVHSTEAA